MNRRLLTILLAAFFIAALCTFLVYRLVSGRMSATRPTATIRVVAAKSEIKLGYLLNADNLKTIEVGTLPKGAILAKDVSRVIGRGVLSDIYEGEPIIEDRLAAVGSGGGLASTIPPGMRACAVKVDDVVNVSGFVTPGMRVDVLISGTPPGEQNPTQGTVSRTLLQNIQVLSAGADIQKDAEGKAKQVQVVNLLVTPEQAETLSLASNQVKIQLVLRNPLDTKVTTVTGTDTGNLFGNTKAAPVKAHRTGAPRSTAPPSYTIEVINGSKTGEEKFASPEGHK
jgi:pilus assembly protein CpaB